MGDLIVQLIPPLLGIIFSPLAIMALIAVLVSDRPRANGIAYAVGWGIGVAAVTLLFLWLFPILDVHSRRDPPIWSFVLRLVLGTVLMLAAVWVYRRGAARIQLMAAATSPRDVAAAAPVLPGWLQGIASFRPWRTALLGIGLFVVNPVDASCAIIAALDMTLADVSGAERSAMTAIFIVLGILPIAIPVAVVLIKGSRATPALESMRQWIAGNTHVLNAALLLVVGAIQFEKALTGLL